ncbi:MAG: hypothetical protein E7329_04980 [Clostridiales bacterium]|nr:hypothetical protein [Clostridiales bacterium]
MKRPVPIDPFFYRQPEKAFLQELTKPVHLHMPSFFGLRPVRKGEARAQGLYLQGAFPEDQGLLDTVYQDFARFLQVHKMQGSSYPVRFIKEDVGCFESYEIRISEKEAVIAAGDTEGARRALIYLEDEMLRREGPFLPLGIIRRSPVLSSRITRCFFSPINRPPKFGDELSDDIDYYPEEYLNRLMHDGANGVWIYTRFSDLVEVSAIPEYGKGAPSRIEKLNRVIQKCARYGIRVYVFAIEPVALPPEQSIHIPQADGGPAVNGNRLFCVNSKEGREMIREAGRKLFERCPDLGGLISITYGERPTSCSSAYSAIPAIGYERKSTCPRCRELTPGQMVANAAKALAEGVHEASPNAKVISWTYGHRFWPLEEIPDYVHRSPKDAILMQNFEEMGYQEQLGHARQGVDYWLSYIGPSPLFETTAREAMAAGKEMFMKIQACCSHEVASVPYVPSPGILFEKYKAAHDLHITGVMQCWYFGNYPSLMSKAAGEMAFLHDYTDKGNFLCHLAGIYFGQSRAREAVRAWQLFEKAYAQYPLNIMFSYYGPMHDGPVWELQLLPKNYPLSRSWQTLDPTIGDRIGECLLNGHTLSEALTLTGHMAREWKEGTKLLEQACREGEQTDEQLSVARALSILFESGHAILRFYFLREQLGNQEGDALSLLDEMRAIVLAEKERSLSLKALCQSDSRLGYHSEGEGFKFFPEKLDHRVAQLERLLQEEFPLVEGRIQAGKAPLAYYAGEEAEGAVYALSPYPIHRAPWEPVGNAAVFRAVYDEKNLTLEILSDTEAFVDVGFEFSLLWPAPQVRLHRDGRVEILPETYLYFSVFGETLEQVKALWQPEVIADGHSFHLLIPLSRKQTAWMKNRPLKMRLVTESGASWAQDEDPVHTLGKSCASPGEFGWLLPGE